MTKQITAFQVKGIGHDLSKSAGTLWYSGPASITHGDYAWVRALTVYPSESETSATPGEGELNLSSYSPKFDLQKNVHQTLLARQTQPSFQLQSGIDSNDPTIDLKSAGSLSVPTDIYIGSETMKVTSDNGGGQYSVDRGFWSSEAISHGVNAGVFERPPYYKWRLVIYKSFGSDGTLYNRWYGYLNERPVLRDGTQLKMSCEEAYKLLDGAKTNNIAPKLSYLHPRGGLKYINREQPDGTIDSEKISTQFDSNIQKDKDRNGNEVSYTDERYWGSWILRDKENDSDSKQTNDEGGEQKGPKEFIHPIQEVVRQSPARSALTDYDIYEIAYWDRSKGVMPYLEWDFAQVYDNKWHPVAIASTFLFSTDSDQADPANLDFLNGNIGLGAKWLFGDSGIQAFKDIVNEETGRPTDGHSIQIDKYIAGFGGKPIEPLQNVLELMVGAGYFFGLSDKGRPIPKRWRRAGAADLAEAEKNVLTPVFDEGGDRVWKWNPDGSFNTFVVSGKVGGSEVTDPFTLEINNLEAGSRLKRLNDPESSSYDYSWLDRETPQLARDLLQRQSEFMHAQMPTVRFSVSGDPKVDTDLNLSIGAFGILDIPQEVDPALTYDVDGSILRPSNAIRPDKFVGMIIGRTWNPKTDRYIIEMMLTNYDGGLTRYRAPCGRVVITDTSSNTRVHLKKSGNSPFALGKNEAQTFEKGQVVQLLNPDLSPKGIGSVRGGQYAPIKIVGSDLLLLGNLGFDEKRPEAGDIVTLATYDDFSSNNTYRHWSFLADASDNLGTNDDEGDIWA